MIAQALRSKSVEVYKEVTCLAAQDSIRRIDIITINRKKNVADIVDPTIRFEISKTRPSNVDREKKAIYEPKIPYFLDKYNIENISVTGVRGTVTKFFVSWREKYKIEREVQEKMVITIIKYSVAILRSHLYGLN